LSIVLEANVEEKSTGELQLSAGYSSLERFIFNFSIRQRNFRGKGQELRASVSYSNYSKSVELGFTEPYLFDRNIAVGGDIFRRDYNSFGFTGNTRRTSYQQITTGAQLRAGLAITEFWSLALRYGLSYDEISLDKFQYYYDTNGDGINDTCDPLIGGRYLCDSVGNRTTSSLGYSVVFDNLNNRVRPSGGQRMVFSQDFAGLGGSVKYLRTRFDAAKYWKVLGNFIFSTSLEGGIIKPFGKERGAFNDRIRINDRFQLGEPEMRGFDIRGIGPRIRRQGYLADGITPNPDKTQFVDDALGGRYYYKGRLELEIPLGSGAKELGLRPSLFVDFGSVWGVKRPFAGNVDAYLPNDQRLVRPILNSAGGLQCWDGAQTSTVATRPAGGGCSTGLVPYNNILQPFQYSYFGDSWKPRLSIGAGVNWNSPFGPFRIDIGKALLKQAGDDTKLFTFNVGTQF
jgi:outer membrane protein insertion porin family